MGKPLLHSSISAELIDGCGYNEYESCENHIGSRGLSQFYDLLVKLITAGEGHLSEA